MLILHRLIEWLYWFLVTECKALIRLRYIMENKKRRHFKVLPVCN